jgi:hypothetical protein
VSRDDNDVTAMWREARYEQQERRAARLPIRVSEIEALQTEGFRVRKMTDYQFRINGRLDLYPIHRRYHDTRTNRRGNYQSALGVAVRILRGQP